MTPCLNTQNGRLPQTPQSPILANYRGTATSWLFVTASTCPHDPVNAAPALTHLSIHIFAPADRTDNEDVVTSRNCTDYSAQPLCMVLYPKQVPGESKSDVWSKMSPHRAFNNYSRNVH